MNLAIEYLIRTGAIKQFFCPPQNVFLENGERRLAISVEESDCPDSYRVTHWDLLSLEESGLPQQTHFVVPKDQLFSSEHVLLRSFAPLRYREQSIDTDCNEYNHPMRAEIFNSFVKHYLNSRAHQRLRLSWLWASFTELFFHRPFMAWKQHDVDVDYEHFLVEQEHPTKWGHWCDWKRHLLLPGQVAGELVFASVYELKQRRFVWDLPF